MNTDNKLKTCVACKWSVSATLGQMVVMKCQHPKALRDPVTGAPVTCDRNRSHRGEMFSLDGYNKTVCNVPGFFFEPRWSGNSESKQS